MIPWAVGADLVSARAIYGPAQGRPLQKRGRGFVLAAVLFALVLLAALTSAGFFAALQEHRAGVNAAGLLRTETAADAATLDIIAGWNPALMDSMPVGASIQPALPSPPGVSVLADVRRTGLASFLVRVDASDPSATRSSRMALRLRGFDFTPAATVRVRSLDAWLAPLIVGADQSPPGWNCASIGDTIAPLIVQSGASDSTFLRFGSRDWAAMVAWAAAVPAGGDSLTIQYWRGNLVLTAARVVGLLIVEGDLTLDAGAEVVGIALVRGSVILRGTGGTIRGALIASQLHAAAGLTTSGPVAVYASCAIEAAGHARAFPTTLAGAPATRFF